MPRDIKITQNKQGVFDINFKNGDIESTDGLDSAFYMSIFYKQRADADQVQVSQYREGHFTDIFNDDINYRIGCYYWLYSDQSRLDQTIISLVEDTVRNDGLQWLIDDDVVRDIKVVVESLGNGYEITASFDSSTQDNSRYYQAFINTFS
jgi:phage gp46-like protein